MLNLNKALIVGRITKDPELKSLPSGVSVCSFSVATNETYKDKSGNKKEETDFHNIVVFGRQAETCGQYLKKGQSTMIEGRIQTRTWDKDGVKMYRTEILADKVQFGAKATGSPSKEVEAEKVTSTDEEIEYPEDEIDPESIPF